MPSDAISNTLSDILHHIDLATSFVTGYDRAAFIDDVRTIYAVTRCLEVISEASRRLPPDLKETAPLDRLATNGGSRQRLPAQL
jgi:uncharacterized protein with HEPN domain